jgi:hypothetical protein
MKNPTQLITLEEMQERFQKRDDPFEGVSGTERSGERRLEEEEEEEILGVKRKG